LALAAADDASAADIRLPADGDTYSALVARAAAHDDTVDFQALRYAYLNSAAEHRAANAMNDIAQWQREMMTAASGQTVDAATVRDRAEKILSLDFTDMLAHKYLRQSCELLHDAACADLHHFLEFGLLHSIMQTGDGKTCATGWEATQIKEEYFMLNMLDTRVTMQSLVSDGGHSCDAMHVRDENGAEQVYYFAIDKMMAAEAAGLGLPAH
jgi:hypothetical protein